MAGKKYTCLLFQHKRYSCLYTLVSVSYVLLPVQENIQNRGTALYVKSDGVLLMNVFPFLVIETVIFPGDKGILSLLTPVATLNCCVELPQVNVTSPG